MVEVGFQDPRSILTIEANWLDGIQRRSGDDATVVPFHATDDEIHGAEGIAKSVGGLQPCLKKGSFVQIEVQ